MRRPQLWCGALWSPAWAREFETDEVGCGEMLSLSHPDVIYGAQRDLLLAGADAISTNTLGALRSVMNPYGTADEVYRVNVESARVACAARDGVLTEMNRAFVVGSIGPTLSVYGHTAVFDDYVEQVTGLIDGGVDALHVEAAHNVVIARAALMAIREVAPALPTVVTARMEATRLMLDGSSYEEFAAIVAPFSLMGFGCAGTMLPKVSPSVVLRDAFAPGFGWIASPEALAQDLAKHAIEPNVEIVGVRVGVTPEFVRAFRRLVGL